MNETTTIAEKKTKMNRPQPDPNLSLFFLSKLEKQILELRKQLTAVRCDDCGYVCQEEEITDEPHFGHCPKCKDKREEEQAEATVTCLHCGYRPNSEYGDDLILAQSQCPNCGKCPFE